METAAAVLGHTGEELRGWLLDEGLVEMSDHSLADIESADALGLCNALRGILPVVSLGARAWAPHPALAELQERLAMAYPMFSEARFPDTDMDA